MGSQGSFSSLDQSPGMQSARTQNAWLCPAARQAQ